MPFPEASVQSWPLQCAKIFMMAVCVLTLPPAQSAWLEKGDSPLPGASPIFSIPLLIQSYALESVNRNKEEAECGWVCH